MKILWKWNWFIIIFTLACSMIVVIISFSMPEIYEVSMMIEPGVVDTDQSGKPVYVDLPLNIKSKIDSQAYNIKIYEKLYANTKKLSLDLKTVHPRNSNTIKIRIELRDINEGIQLLSALFYELAEEYQHYVDSRKLELDEKIGMNKRQLDISVSEKKYLEKEISTMKANTDRIIEERDMVLRKGEDNPEKLSLLIYSNIIQQNMALYNDLIKRLGKLMNDIEKMKSEMDIVKIKKQSIENIKLIQPPLSSIYPVKPKKKLNVILAFFIGLMFSVLFTFFLEYLQKVKAYPESPTTTTQQEHSVKNQE